MPHYVTLVGPGLEPLNASQQPLLIFTVGAGMDPLDVSCFSSVTLFGVNSSQTASGGQEFASFGRESFIVPWVV